MKTSSSERTASRSGLLNQPQQFGVDARSLAWCLQVPTYFQKRVLVFAVQSDVQQGRAQIVDSVDVERRHLLFFLKLISFHLFIQKKKKPTQVVEAK